MNTRQVVMPLREPFETARRRATESGAVLVTLQTDRGISGSGAATPLQYVTGETPETVVESVKRAADAVAGVPVRSFASLAGILSEHLPDAPSARAAVEMAIVDAAGREAARPSFEMLGGAVRTIESDLTIPVVPPDHAASLARDAAAKGFRTFKVKVGSKEPDEDLARVLAISAAAPEASFVLDANQGFVPQAAVDFIVGLLQKGILIDLFEQPVDALDIDGLEFLSRELDVPVFADEAARTPADVARLIRHHAVDGINVKLMKSGLFGALEIASMCARAGLDLMLGCMLEHRIGITAALHVACAAPAFRHFDLDSDLLLAGDSAGGFTRQGAMVAPVAGPGLNCPL